VAGVKGVKWRDNASTEEDGSGIENETLLSAIRLSSPLHGFATERGDAEMREWPCLNSTGE